MAFPKKSDFMRLTDPQTVGRIASDLSTGAMYGQEEKVLELLCDPCFQNPLSASLSKAVLRGVWGASSGNHAGTLRTLVRFCKEKGLNWSYLEGTKYNLLTAIERLSADSVDVLLAEGADPNFYGPNYFEGAGRPKFCSPFQALYDTYLPLQSSDHRSLNYYHEWIAESLLRAGAYPQLRLGRKSALDLAKRNPEHPVSAIIFNHLGLEPRRGFLGRTALKPASTWVLKL